MNIREIHKKLEILVDYRDRAATHEDWDTWRKLDAAADELRKEMWELVNEELADPPHLPTPPPKR